jgi:hypothetical protein
MKPRVDRPLTERQVQLLQIVDRLPDDFILPDPVAAVILNQSVKTLGRNEKVPRVRTSERTGGRHLGKVRAAARG